jgi:hypothetical protein
VAIKYRYALDEDQHVIDIFDLTEVDRKDYECVACGQTLRPVMGSERQNHFRHTVDMGCSEETYLHRLGKFLFHQVYQERLQAGEPFEIELSRLKICTVCEKYGPCEISVDPVKYDLTQFFPKIVLETPDDGFIPDLLLFNDEGEKLYVEIAVTHLSTEEKRTSDHRIIELNVEQEEDLEIIKTCLLPETDGRVEFVGFNLAPEKGDFSSECNNELTVFYLWRSGKSVMLSPSVAEFRQDYHNEAKRFYFSIVPYRSGDCYVEAVERAHIRGLKVKSCYLCRYHGKANHHQRLEMGKPIFCKFLKELKGANDAADCEYYRPDTSTFWIHENGQLQDLPRERKPFLPNVGMRKALKRL